ncbi:MAG: TetR/AcrR family transcriptional regulator [Bacteroidales bacterium]|nr:TetR/AcrR family transcriptional regulator [Bacteroidales bacterium]
MIKEHILEKQKRVRQKIIVVASSVFNKYGFKKATIEDIAKTAGMGKSSIYYYFKSKEDIFEAVVEQEAIELNLELTEKVINTNDNPKEKVKNYVLIRMKFLKEMVNFFEALKDDYLRNLPFTIRIRKKYDKQEQQMLSKIFNEGVSQDIFYLNNIEFTALALVTFLKGLESSLIINEEMEYADLEENLDRILEVIFHGILK